MRVAQSTAYPFAADNVAPDTGAPQSFRRRINDAVTRWNSLYEIGTPKPKTLVKVADGGTNEILYQQMPNASAKLGETWWRRTQDDGTSADETRCPRPPTGSSWELLKVHVRIYNRADWFTQDDPYRAAWEACPNSVGYTCQKQYDFGSVAAHELGHALGLRHTSESTNAVRVDCPGIVFPLGSPYQPTLCAGLTAHRTEQRTPEPYDLDTLHMNVRYNVGLG